MCGFRTGRGLVGAWANLAKHRHNMHQKSTYVKDQTDKVNNKANPIDPVEPMPNPIVGEIEDRR